MVVRRRIPRLIAPAAVCLALALAGLNSPSPAGAQDPSVSTTSGTRPSSVIGEAPTTVTDPGLGPDPTSENQTVVETAEPTETALFTESRKIMAVIAGLICVALGLAWLTYRFWRATKPYRDEEPDSTAAGEPAPAPPETGEVAIAEPPLADHHGADTDWEPRTGEHVRIEPSVVGMVRPSEAIRRATLGVAAEPEVPIASDHG